jgi:hypothetical protein
LTFTTNADHYYVPGDVISTSGFDEPGFNLTDVVVESTPTDTTFTVTSDATGTSSAGIAIKKTYPRLDVQSVVGNGTTATVTAENHGLQVGQAFGYRRSAFDFAYGDGVKVASVVNANTFTFNSAVDATANGGFLKINTIGNGLSVNDAIYFRNVFSVGGTDINARVTFTSQNRLVGGLIETLQDSPVNANEANYLRTAVPFTNASGDGFAELTFLYFTGSPATATSNSETLRNVTISIYDVDDLEFTEITNVKTVEALDPFTILTIDPPLSHVGHPEISIGRH